MRKLVWIPLSDVIFMRINLGETGLGKTKITRLLVAERDQLVNACVVSPHLLFFIDHGSSTDLLNLAAPILGLDSTQTMSSEREARSTIKRTLRSTTCGHTRRAHLPRHPLELADFAVLGPRRSLPNRTREYLLISNHFGCRRSGLSPVCRCSAACGNW